jgi:uncharacterized protein (TIGR04255 family)
MSKLPNAPLVEVIFEVRWNIEGQEELAVYQYLQGDLYAEVKKDYPFREALVPPEVPLNLFLQHAPTHRFRTKEGGYPLLQIGLGLFTVNTNDGAYEWTDYQQRCLESLDLLSSVYEPLQTKKYLTLILQYQDFLPFDFQNSNVYDYLAENLHIEIKQPFYSSEQKPYTLNFGFHYQTEYGNFEVHLQQAQKNDTYEEGILIRTLLANFQAIPNKLYIQDWLHQAHEIVSASFKKMTEGKLFASFQQKS